MRSFQRKFRKLQRSVVTSLVLLLCLGTAQANWYDFIEDTYGDYDIDINYYDDFNDFMGNASDNAVDSYFVSYLVLITKTAMIRIMPGTGIFLLPRSMGHPDPQIQAAPKTTIPLTMALTQKKRMMIAMTPVFAMAIVMRKYLMGQQIILLMKTNQQTNQKKRIVMKSILKMPRMLQISLTTF